MKSKFDKYSINLLNNRIIKLWRPVRTTDCWAMAERKEDADLLRSLAADAVKKVTIFIHY